jgi:glucose-1-phosphate cytidylyltransferase
MKTIILAGGLGTRISEETESKPKPMVLIDDKPLIWHVMNIYASQGYDEFIVAAGYKAEIIEDWVKKLKTPWKVTSIDTGLTTMTGGRIKRCIERLPAERYFVTYGDGVGNVDLKLLLEFHLKRKRLATVTAVRPPARFGVLDIEDGVVKHFGEKNQTDSGWINGGFFVIENSVKDYIHGDSDLFETGPLPKLAEENQLSAHQHNGFWKPMDTLREKKELQDLASLPTPPWLAFSPT